MRRRSIVGGRSGSADRTKMRRRSRSTAVNTTTAGTARSLAAASAGLLLVLLLSTTAPACLAAAADRDALVEGARFSTTAAARVTAAVAERMAERAEEKNEQSWKERNLKKTNPPTTSPSPTSSPPTSTPSASPTHAPSSLPSVVPTAQPSYLPTELPSLQPTPYAEWKIFLTNDFDSGLQDFSLFDAGDARYNDDTDYTWDGSEGSLRIQDNSGDDSSVYLATPLNLGTTGGAGGGGAGRYEIVRTEFKFYGDDMDEDEAFLLEYALVESDDREGGGAGGGNDDGNFPQVDWQTARRWEAEIDFDNWDWYADNVVDVNVTEAIAAYRADDPPASANNATTEGDSKVLLFYLRFRCDASANQDRIYIDDVVLSGKKFDRTPSPTMAPTTPSPTHAPTSSPTVSPTEVPTVSPTGVPTRSPAMPGDPTSEPTTGYPTVAPTTASPTEAPTATPTAAPTVAPTTQAPAQAAPTKAPTSPTPPTPTTPGGGTVERVDLTPFDVSLTFDPNGPSAPLWDDPKVGGLVARATSDHLEDYIQDNLNANMGVELNGVELTATSFSVTAARTRRQRRRLMTEDGADGGAGGIVAEGERGSPLLRRKRIRRRAQDDESAGEGGEAAVALSGAALFQSTSASSNNVPTADQIKVWIEQALSTDAQAKSDYLRTLRETGVEDGSDAGDALRDVEDVKEVSFPSATTGGGGDPNPIEENPDDDDDDGSMLYVIIGVAAGVACFVILGMGFVYVRRNQRRTKLYRTNNNKKSRGGMSSSELNGLPDGENNDGSSPKSQQTASSKEERATNSTESTKKAGAAATADDAPAKKSGKSGGIFVPRVRSKDKKSSVRFSRAANGATANGNQHDDDRDPDGENGHYNPYLRTPSHPRPTSPDGISLSGSSVQYTPSIRSSNEGDDDAISYTYSLDRGDDSTVATPSPQTEHGGVLSQLGLTPGGGPAGDGSWEAPDKSGVFRWADDGTRVVFSPANADGGDGNVNAGTGGRGGGGGAGPRPPPMGRSGRHPSDEVRTTTSGSATIAANRGGKYPSDEVGMLGRVASDLDYDDDDEGTYATGVTSAAWSYDRIGAGGGGKRGEAPPSPPPPPPPPPPRKEKEADEGIEVTVTGGSRGAHVVEEPDDEDDADDKEFPANSRIMDDDDNEEDEMAAWSSMERAAAAAAAPTPMRGGKDEGNNKKGRGGRFGFGGKGRSKSSQGKQQGPNAAARGSATATTKMDNAAAAASGRVPAMVNRYEGGRSGGRSYAARNGGLVDRDPSIGSNKAVARSDANGRSRSGGNSGDYYPSNYKSSSKPLSPTSRDVMALSTSLENGSWDNADQGGDDYSDAPSDEPGAIKPRNRKKQHRKNSSSPVVSEDAIADVIEGSVDGRADYGDELSEGGMSGYSTGSEVLDDLNELSEFLKERRRAKNERSKHRHDLRGDDKPKPKERWM